MYERAPYSAHLRIDQADDKSYRVLLDEVPLQNLLAADGLSITFEWDEASGQSHPVVGLRFAPGALELDLDAELVADILRHSEAV